MNEFDVYAIRQAMISTTIPVERNKNKTIRNLMPHYTNDVFKTARTVYLAKGYTLKDTYVEGAGYDYSDRIRQWYTWKKCERAWKLAERIGACASRF
jgi:hypothetical protein